MTGFGIPEAVKFLRQGGHGEIFDEQFFAKPGVKGAIFQGLLDAAGEKFDQAKVEKYSAELLDKLEGKPSEDLPFNLQVKRAQLIVYQKALTLDTTPIS